MAKLPNDYELDFLKSCTKEELKAMSSEELLEQLGQKIQKIFKQH